MDFDSGDTYPNTSPKFNFTGGTHTAGAAGDKEFSLTATLNDAATAGGETYTMWFSNLTVTNGTGWPTIKLAEWQVGGNAYHTLGYDGGSTVFNENSVDIDFRIETAAEANAFVIDAGAETATFGVPITLNDTLIKKQGTDIASATTIVIPTDGNTFELTGTTAVTLITTTGYQDGHEITLVANESVVMTNGTATSGANVTILLAAAGNYSMTANDTLKLVLSTTTAGGQAWRETGRSVN